MVSWYENEYSRHSIVNAVFERSSNKRSTWIGIEWNGIWLLLDGNYRVKKVECGDSKCVGLCMNWTTL